jgi:hypothetical protein
MAIYQDPNEDPTQGRGYPTRGYWDGTGHPPTTPTTPTTPPAPTDPWATAPADGNWEAWFLKNVQGLAPNPANLWSLQEKLKPHGITIKRNANGLATGWITLPDGSEVDVGGNFSSGDPSRMRWYWGTNHGNAAATQKPITVDPSYLAPFTEQFGYQDFQAPGQEQVYADPGYQFRLNEGRGVLENSAAARGLLNSGGTLQDLMRWGQGFASQEYGNVFNREFDTWSRGYDNAFRNWQARRDTHYANQNNPWAKLYQASNQGTQATV